MSVARRTEYFRTSPPVSAIYPQALPGPVASVETTVPMMDPTSSEDHSWQDVYASYGCSVEFDVSAEDDGG